jgi:peptidyl-prolyl cis-trans isomerase B (cyclophilin B)
MRAAMLIAAGAMFALVVGVVSVMLVQQGPEPGTADAVACQPPPAPQTAPVTLPAAPDPSVAAHAQWDVTLHTTCGDIRLVLDGAAAPRTVASFVTLAQAGYWHDSVCHRLTTKQAPTAYLQCGDPTGHSTATPGYDLPLENTPADRRYRVGTVGMARGDGYPSTSGEFFIVHEDFTLPADHVAYSVIGRVVSGQEVVRHIADEGGEDTRPDGPPFQSISVRDVVVSRRS